MFHTKEDEKRKLMKNLSLYLEKNPEESADFMGVISNALKNFRKGVEDERNHLAQNAIGMIIQFIRKDANKRFHKVGKDIQIPVLIDAIYYFIPTGDYSNSSLSTGEKEIVDMFKQRCIEEDILNNNHWSDWLKSTKGHDYYEWMKKFISN